MKGFQITRDNQTIYLYNKNDMVEFAAHVLYYTVNPKSEMCIPNIAYEKADKMFEEWCKEAE